MANSRQYLLFLYSFLLSSSVFIKLDAAPSNDDKEDFIKSACKATHFESTCFESLSPYEGKIGNSDRELAHMALIVSFLKCRSLSQSLQQFKIEGANGAAVTQCSKVMSGTIYHHVKAVRELESTANGSHGEEFFKQMSSIQHHVNSAMNSQDTCAEALLREKSMDTTLKAVIKKMVQQANECTANALALVDSYSVVGGGNN